MPNNAIVISSAIRCPLLIINEINPRSGYPFIKANCCDKHLSSNEKLSSIDSHDCAIAQRETVIIPAKRPRISPSPRQVIQQKLAEIENNDLQLVPINRAGEQDILHDVAINSIRQEYHQQILTHVPVMQITDIFKAQARTAKNINDYYANQLLKGAVAGAREYSYILLDKLLSSGIFNENLMIFHLTHDSEIKHTALLYSPQNSLRKLFGTTAPFFDPREHSVLQLVTVMKARQEPYIIFNPWSADNKILRIDVSTTASDIKRKFALMLHEAGINIAEQSVITALRSAPKNQFTLDSLTLSLPESIADTSSSMALDEKEFLNDIEQDNYTVIARGESVLNQPVGTVAGKALTFRDLFNSAIEVLEELSGLSDHEIRKFARFHFGTNNLPAKVDVLKRAIVHAKSKLQSYYTGGDRLSRLLFLQPKVGRGVEPVMAFVSNADTYDVQFLSFVNHPDWQGENIFYYVNSIQTLLHEISHVKESDAPLAAKPLYSSDFIYSDAENLNVVDVTFDCRMNYYSGNNNLALEEVNEKELTLMDYNEYLLFQSQHSDGFKLIKEAKLFEHKIRTELNKDILSFKHYLQNNSNYTPSFEHIRQSEFLVHNFMKDINRAFKRVGIAKKSYALKPLTMPASFDNRIQVIDERVIEDIYTWIHEVAVDKERRIAVVLSNADSVADYQLLLAARNNLLAKHLANEGMLHRPNPDLPWEIVDSEGSASDSAD